MKKVLVCLLALAANFFSGLVAAQAVMNNGQMTRYITAGGEIKGKLIVQVTRPEWDAEKTMETMARSRKSMEHVVRLLNLNRVYLEYGSEGRRLPEEMCIITIEGATISYQNCHWIQKITS